MADESKKKRSEKEGREPDEDGTADMGAGGAADGTPSTPEGGAETGGGQGEREESLITEAEEEIEADGEPPVGTRLAVSRAELNQLSMGELTVHFQNRSVTFAMDGQSALRMLSVLVGHRHSVTLDLIDPEKASAFRGWIMVDATEVVGAEWNPLPRPSRVAVDPPSDHKVRVASRALYEGRISEDMLLDTPVEPADLISVGVG